MLPRVVLTGCVVLVLSLSFTLAQTPAGKAILLNVSKNQLPSDTGMDDKTHPEIVNDFAELGGKALKIPFAPGDSFGGRVGAEKNWKRFALFRCDVFNPAKETVSLELTVVHARSTSHQTRVVMPISLKAGKNEVKIGIDEMSNVNGSNPDLANVVKWYINDTDQKGPTLYFSDIWLEGGEPPVTGGSKLPGRFKIKGKIGTQDVDLTLTADDAPGALASVAAAKGAAVHGDPARLARIKAAKKVTLDKPVSFDDPAADAVLAALETFPPDNPWNLDVSDWPLHPNSANIIATIGVDKPFRCNPDMAFVLVPPKQPRVEVQLTGYPEESDKGPFPVPDNIPIEGWPVGFKGASLDDVQRDKSGQGGDRHAIVVDPANRMLYEFYQLKKTGKGWEAAQSSIFDLKSNAMRPDGWTSTDAAGLPIFPSIVRFDELQRGVIEHALRVTVVKTRREYVYPARHFASSKTDENLPRMGERIRLKRDFNVSEFTPQVQTILKALKQYGMFVADNGIDWAISVAPDPRIPELHAELRKIKGSAFEVVQPPEGYSPPE